MSRREGRIYYQSRWDDYPFPCWIEVSDTGVSGSRLSGKWMGRDFSPRLREVPKRHPHLQKVVLSASGQLQFFLISPSYWEGWSLLLQSEGKEAIYIPCTGNSGSGLVADLGQLSGHYTARLFCQKPTPYSLEVPLPELSPSLVDPCDGSESP